jgi:hypothetical protein
LIHTLIGKIIISILLIGAILAGVVWFFTGQSPLDLVKDMSNNGNQATSDNVDKLEYEYTVHLDEPHRMDNNFIAQFHIVKRTSDTICYAYTVTDIKKGNPDFIRGFMKGFYSAGENTTMCTPLDVESKDFIPIFPLADPGTSISGKKAGSDYMYTYHYSHGILQSFEMTTTYTIGNDTVPAKITISLTKTVRVGSSEMGSPTPTKAVGNSHTFSSMNVSWVTYRFLWDIPVQDVVTGQVTRHKTLDYNVKVEVVSRQGSQACIRYTITSITVGNRSEVAQYTEGILGYSPGSVQCVDLSKTPTPQDIPYFLFNPSFTKTDININGEGVSGVFSVQNGIFYSLVVNMENQIQDNNGNTVSSAVTTLRVSILDMG